MADPLSIPEFVNRLTHPRISKDVPPIQEDLIEAILKADDTLFGAGTESRACSRALLLLQAGDLQHSHTIVQELTGKSPAYVHGMLHRVEGDFSNAKYWFRRAGDHPAFVNESIDPLDLTDRVAKSTPSPVSKDLSISLRLEFDTMLAFLLKN